MARPDELKLQEVFEEKEHGPAGRPTQAGFVALARAGKAVWGLWRRNHPKPKLRVDFSNVDFSAEPSLKDFGGFDFRNGVSFAGATFAPGTNFAEAHFPAATTFADARFQGSATFERAVFEGAADFDRVTVTDAAAFIGTRFSGAFSCRNATLGRGTSFAGSALTEDACFDGATFGEDTSFEGTSFKKRTSFERTIMNSGTTFEKAGFEGTATFRAASFAAAASFASARFSDAGADFGESTWADGYSLSRATLPRSDFSRTTFGNGGSFAGTQFANANFEGAKFGNDTDFSTASFGRAVSFCSSFGAQARFDQARFMGPAVFDGARFGLDASFRAAEFQNIASYRGTIFDGNVSFRGGIPGNDFRGALFEGAQFLGEADFSDREFKGPTRFGRLTTKSGAPKVVFHGAPSFHNSKLHQDTDFDDAEFPDVQSAHAHRAYRTLKLAMSDHQAIREQQKFFRLEMMAEAARLERRGVKALYRAYEYLSNYGLSVKRPLIAWAAVSAVAWAAYAWVAGLQPCLGEGPCDWELTWRSATFAFLSGLPVPGVDRTSTLMWKEISSSELVGTGYPLVQAVHKTFSLVLFFLFALGVRNLFKLK